MHCLETIIRLNREEAEKQSKLDIAISTLETLKDNPQYLSSLGAWCMVANTLEELKS